MKRLMHMLLLSTALASMSACGGKQYTDYELAKHRALKAKHDLLDSVMPGEPYSLSEAEIEAIHMGVRRRLKDPESARFNAISASHHVKADGSQGVLACGLVNGKNAYGGYVGDQLFYGMLNKIGDRSVFLAVSGPSSRSDMQMITYEMCVEARIMRRFQP